MQARTRLTTSRSSPKGEEGGDLIRNLNESRAFSPNTGEGWLDLIIVNESSLLYSVVTFSEG
jgi:hypothetical protein